MPDIIYTTDEQIEAMKRELDRALDPKTLLSENGGNPAVWLKRATGAFLSLIILLLALTFLLIMYTKSRGETPTLFGYQLYVIETGSMEPTLKVGSIILTKVPKDAAKLKKDDIVTFRTKSGSVVTHRIIEVIAGEDGNPQYRTKGDNPTNSPDAELLDPERVIAEFVAKLPLT